METQQPQDQTNSLPQKPTQEITSKSPSPLSSPTHEFSFTITLHPSPNSSPNTFKPNNKKPSSPSFALDLAPADDIFFHGHLLPLHLLSHTHISPRPSTDMISMEDLYPRTNNIICGDINNNNTKEKKKQYSFSFRLSRWFEEKKKKKKKVFDIKHLLRKYLSMVEPLFLSKKNKGKHDLRRPYSFSVSSNYKERDPWVLKRRDYSAPASTRTSPTNSGLLVTPAKLPSSDKSSMDELQNAIQAAIAHCKGSTTTKERAV